MTVRKEYRCNLCRDCIENETKGVGIRFDGSHLISFKMLQDAENHLCNYCIAGIKVETARLDEADRARQERSQ